MNVNGNQFPNGYNHFGFENQQPNNENNFMPRPAGFFPNQPIPPHGMAQPMMHQHPTQADIFRAEQLINVIATAKLDSEEMGAAMTAIADTLATSAGLSYTTQPPSSKFAWLMAGKSISTRVIQEMVAAVNEAQTAISITIPESVTIQLHGDNSGKQSYKIPDHLVREAFDKLFEKGRLVKTTELQDFINNSNFWIGAKVCSILPSVWRNVTFSNFNNSHMNGDATNLAKALINYVRDQGHANYSTMVWLMGACNQVMADIAVVRSSPLAQDLELPEVSFVPEFSKAPPAQFGFQNIAPAYHKLYRVASKTPDAIVIELLQDNSFGNYGAASFDNAPAKEGY